MQIKSKFDEVSFKLRFKDYKICMDLSALQFLKKKV